MVAGGVLGSASATKSLFEQKYVVRGQNEILSDTPGVNWNKSAVASFDPENNSITLADGSRATYDILVVNPGLQLRYDLIEGA
jgi:sulfide:quinone oxidoreductase|mmetsp:Transcript_14993/g.20346  ORF Transcript_14993/g.20346 Transcript_14993/m.20346 type:complete len:83 (+) Transcript_14993:208-456(+)